MDKRAVVTGCRTVDFWGVAFLVSFKPLGAMVPASAFEELEKILVIPGGPCIWVLLYMTNVDHQGRKVSGAVMHAAPALSLLTQRAPLTNIVVGSDEAQIHFLEQKLRKEITLLPFVDRKTLIERPGCLYCIRSLSDIANLSAEEWMGVGVWTADSITSGSEHIQTLVRYAHQALHPMTELDPELAVKVGDEVIKQGIHDIYESVGLACWLLSEPPPYDSDWAQPWDHHLHWLPSGLEPTRRLEVLHSTMRRYVTRLSGSAAAFAGFDASNRARLKALELPQEKVRLTLGALEDWRNEGLNKPFRCFMRISFLWRGVNGVAGLSKPRSTVKGSAERISGRSPDIGHGTKSESPADRRLRVLVYAQQNPDRTYAEMADVLGISHRTLARDCQGLRGKNWRKGIVTPIDEDKFWSRVIRAGDGCWCWGGRPNGSGYGTFYANGKAVGAHRIAYELGHGQIPDGWDVHHKCENRLCCNPSHLEAVTHRMNMVLAGIIPEANDEPF